MPDSSVQPGKTVFAAVWSRESAVADHARSALEGAGQHAQSERQPHVAEAWIKLDATKIGYEISFNKYFYPHKPLRSLEEVTRDILQLEEESDGLIREILDLG